MNARSSYSVMILPFDFLPARSWGVGTGAVAKSIDLQAEWAAGVPMCGHTSDGTLFCFENRAGHKMIGRGGGSSVDIYFTSRRHADRLKSPDEVLLHELTHASRKVRGILYRMPMGGGYGNQEEFLAVLVTNIYRSQKGEKHLFDYRSRSIDPHTFLDSLSPSPRTVIAGMRRDQPALFAALAAIQTPFNPVRQVDAEHTQLMRRVERM